jgi:hypothetical protein
MTLTLNLSSALYEQLDNYPFYHIVLSFSSNQKLCKWGIY